MLSVEALRRTFEEIVRRHEGLRTNFASRRGRPVQVITAPTPRPLPLVELVGMGGAGLRRLLRREAARPFDLERNPLLRTILFRLDDREHVLLLVMHHIVSDAWSMGILVRELGLLYAAFRSAPETPAGLSEPAIRYADFAVWQRQWLSGPVLEQQLGYWKSRLAGTPPLELPADRGRPPVRSYRGGLRTFRLPAATVGELRRLSRREGTTLFMTLLAAFQVLLSRCSGQTDVAVGTPIANRGVREIEDLVGFFVNTLVLRTELRPELRFRELLARVRDQALGAYAHQDLPFEYLVDELEVERDLSRTPLFQVMFALQNAFAGELRLPDLRVEPEPVETGTSKFDLTLAIDQDGDALAGMAEYSTELYDATTVARMMQHFEVLLREIPRAVDGTIADLPLLAAAQRHQLLVEWNDPHAFPAPWSSIHEIFAARAARAPDAVALVDGDVRLSYAELDGRAERLARMLRETSAVGPELRVGLLAERSAEMVVGILAVLKAGGAYVPLDPAYPPDRLAFILEDGRVPVLLTQQQLLDRLPEHGARVVCLDRDVPAPGENRPLPAVRPANVAYVIYTSGSTGRPKGVEVTHANGTRLFSATEKWFHFGEDDVWSLFHSVAFDFSVWEIFGALLYGGRLVIVPWEVSRSFGAFYDLVCRERVSVLNQTPSAFAQFVRAGAGRPLPPALRAVVFGGEALDPRKLRRWRQRHPDSELVNMYGITETTVHVTYHPVSDADIKSPGSPIGRRIPDLGLTLLQGFSQPVPIGVAGQIFVTGAGVARGYLGRPGLSAERFLPDPFSAAPGRRMYQTGDLGRFLPDGKLEFLGRIDHQVKMRGYRIELGEIEAVLGEHPAVRAACVVAPETRPGEHRLVAYVVGEKAPPKRLREHLKAKLPEYMVPAVFVALEALPRLPTGKIDRAALSRRALPAERPSEQLCVAPRTPVEELVAGIWAELLDSGGDGRAIGVDDDFFALGGHSLLATQVISRLRQSLGVEVAVRELFEAPTLAALAGRVEAARRSATSPPIVPRRGQGPPPLSFAQQRLWFLDRLAPGNIFYNMPVALRLRGPLTIGALERSLSEIVSRHQTLRTTFATVDGEPVQVIHAAAPRFLPRVELTALSAQAQEVEARRLAREEAERPFDLVAGPLFRAALLHLADAEQVLLLTQHHILADGWSVGVFQRELAALYAAFADHRTPAADLPELPIQYADFAVWQREWLRAEVLDSQLTWWKAQLGDDLPILELPTDRPRPAVRNFRGGVLPVRFEASLSDSLRSLSRQQGATLAMTLLAGFYTLLYRITGQEKIPVGGPIAGRNRREIEDLIGFFVNNLTLVGDLSGQPTFPELLGRVREMALGAYTHQDLPFERLVEELGLRRDLSRNPLFQVIFAVQNAPPEEWTLAGLSVRPLVSGFQSARFDLELSLGEEGEQLHGFCACDRVLFDATTVARWMNHYRRLLEAIVTDPETELTRLPWLAAGERHQLLVEWNGASRPPGDEVGATGRPRFRNASV